MKCFFYLCLVGSVLFSAATAVRGESIECVRQLGTSAIDYSDGVSADGLGNVYISGFTPGSLGGPNAGGRDAFVAKIVDSVVPEPSTLLLLCLGSLAVLWRRRGFVCASILAGVVGISFADRAAADTITISSTFNMDLLVGTVGPDLAEVFANGHEHTWTLTLDGTSQSHLTSTNPFGVTYYATEIHATSFDLEFFGPDAATLNGIVSDHIAGADVFIYLENDYSSGNGDDFSVLFVEPTGPDFQFFSNCDFITCGTLFPTDADGYPVVGPDPFSIWNEYSALIDIRPGNDGYIQSRASLVTFVAVVPDPTGPPGDFNQDGIVDAADYTVWRNNLGSGTSLPNDDTAGVGPDDYEFWKAHFGETAGGGGSTGASASQAAVPEPATLVLLMLTTAGWCLRRVRATFKAPTTH